MWPCHQHLTVGFFPLSLPLEGLFCNRTFDMYACWPDGSPGTAVNVSCPFYLPWFEKGDDDALPPRSWKPGLSHAAGGKAFGVSPPAHCRGERAPRADLGIRGHVGHGAEPAHAPFTPALDEGLWAEQNLTHRPRRGVWGSSRGMCWSFMSAVKHGLVSRRCGADGQWVTVNGSQPWRDYSQCEEEMESTAEEVGFPGPLAGHGQAGTPRPHRWVLLAWAHRRGVRLQEGAHQLMVSFKVLYTVGYSLSLLTLVSALLVLTVFR